MKTFNSLLPILVSSLLITAATAKVQFAGVNIAGCDFGCDGNVRLSSQLPYLNGSLIFTPPGILRWPQLSHRDWTRPDAALCTGLRA